jgi:hypothetical protein
MVSAHSSIDGKPTGHAFLGNTRPMLFEVAFRLRA